MFNIYMNILIQISVVWFDALALPKAVMKFDLEGWFPGQEGMGEDGRISPVSVCNWSVRCLSDFILTFDAFTQLQSWSDQGSMM